MSSHFEIIFSAYDFFPRIYAKGEREENDGNLKVRKSINHQLLGHDHAIFILLYVKQSSRRFDLI